MERMGGSSDKQHGFDRCRREVKQRQSQRMVMGKTGVRMVVLSGKKCLQRVARIPIITILTHGCYDDFPQRVPRWPSLQEAKACAQGRCAIR